MNVLYSLKVAFLIITLLQYTCVEFLVLSRSRCIVHK